jgi:Asp-tRNA(Asn)/Glu-tRNA(Gln) amidotransferase A subunit family amidase
VNFEAREPSCRAFLPEADRFARLRNEARSLQERCPDAETRPPLFGMLAGIKDIFHVEGFATRAGSRLPPEVLQGEEAESVSRLKGAGALIVGKTVTTEFACFSPGPTRNPHNPAHTPGGSSSGSAAAVAAGLCDLALGTQTIGSIVRPAAFCGVFGLKPSYDRIPREGVIPVSPSLDHVGCFTKDVRTAERCARVLYDDWNDVPGTFNKPVLGIPIGPYLEAASAVAAESFRATCRLLADAGYELRQAPILSDFQAVRERQGVIMSGEMARVHASWFEAYRDLYSQKTAELIERGQSVTDEQLQAALAECDEFRAEINKAMLAHRLDAWICPSAPGPAPKGLESTGDPVMNLPWTQAGLPAVNLPAGKDPNGLPMGLQVVAGWYRDESLLGWAAGLEKLLGGG